MPRFLVLTVLVVTCLLIGMLTVQAQLRSPIPRDTGWNNRIVVGLPDDDDEGDDCPLYPAPVAATGQTRCWLDGNPPISCAGTGQDGEYQNGVSVNPRFTDNGDGTVTDNTTGLIWLKEADCFGPRIWTDALSVANNLASGSCGLTDGSVANNWRLPNIRELLTLLDYGQFEPSMPAGHPFSGVGAGIVFWTSTTRPREPNDAWVVGFGVGETNNDDKPFTHSVWPVRGPYNEDGQGGDDGGDGQGPGGPE